MISDTVHFTLQSTRIERCTRERQFKACKLYFSFLLFFLHRSRHEVVDASEGLGFVFHSLIAGNFSLELAIPIGNDALPREHRSQQRSSWSPKTPVIMSKYLRSKSDGGGDGENAEMKLRRTKGTEVSCDRLTPFVCLFARRRARCMNNSSTP